MSELNSALPDDVVKEMTNKFIDIPGAIPEGAHNNEWAFNHMYPIEGISLEGAEDFFKKYFNPLKNFGRNLKHLAKDVAGELNYITCTGYDIDLWEKEPEFHIDTEGNAYWSSPSITDAHIWVRMQDKFKTEVQKFYKIEPRLEETAAYKVCKEYLGDDYE